MISFRIFSMVVIVSLIIVKDKESVWKTYCGHWSSDQIEEIVQINFFLLLIITLENLHLIIFAAAQSLNQHSLCLEENDLWCVARSRLGGDQMSVGCGGSTLM